MQRYRDRLIAGRDSCSLFDTPALVQRLEELYRQICAEYREGRLPRPNLANLDVGIEQDHEETEVQAIEDYRAWWLSKLARRDAFPPIGPDNRLWTEAVIRSTRPKP